MIKCSKIKYDAIIFSEVKLKKGFPIHLYIIPEYKRYANLRSEEGGGGVIVFIKNDIVVEEQTSLTSGFEKLKLMIFNDNRKLKLLAYYRPPIQTNLNQFLSDLENEISSSNSKTIIVGDININTYSLSLRELSHDMITRQYNEMITSYGFKVINNIPTRLASGKTIDHFITNLHNDHTISNVTLRVDDAISDHCALITSVNYPQATKQITSRIIRNKVDLDLLMDNFEDISSVCDDFKNTDEIVEKITEEIKRAVRLSSRTLSFKIKKSENIKDWASEGLLSMIKEKDKLLMKRRKNHMSKDIQEKLEVMSGKLKKKMKDDFNNFMQQMVKVPDPKKLWRNLNVLLGRTSENTIEVIEEAGKKLKNKKEIANTFNNYFVSCASKLADSLEDDNQDQDVEKLVEKSIVFTTPTSKEIEIIISRLKSNSAAGYDEISAKRKMILNNDKTKCVMFRGSRSRMQLPAMIEIGRGISIARISTFKYLGLQLNEFLKWSEHIKVIERKIASSNAILWKLRYSLPTETKKLIYDTLIQSYISYMIQVWGFANYKELSNLQIMQNKALCNTYNLPNRTNRVEMYTHLVESHLPIRGIAVLNTSCHVYKSLNNQTHTNIIHTEAGATRSNMTLRNNSSLRPVKIRTEMREKSIEFIGPSIFNEIPDEIKRSKHQYEFKWCMRCYLRNENFIGSCFDSSFFKFQLR
ncbi:CLUMA_CG016746, isoform A [Clunio marinus]|uniref:CLUMA_CG016746, isoform A n=1 Tax=Clunio marinus TaxID=568069 RepID=A0A1J1IW52_9DIPT|nr:CLUMA_CG016746, isoform A [Clunio marinus]